MQDDCLKQAFYKSQKNYSNGKKGLKNYADAHMPTWYVGAQTFIIIMVAL